MLHVYLDRFVTKRKTNIERPLRKILNKKKK